MVCFFAVILFPAVLMLPVSSHLHQAGDMRVRIAGDSGAPGPGERPANPARSQGNGIAHDKCLACLLIGSAAKQLKQSCSVACGVSTGTICMGPQTVVSTITAQFVDESPMALKTKLNN